MTQEDVEVLVSVIAKATKERFEKALAPVLADLGEAQAKALALEARCRELETRQAAVEQQRYVKFAGVWKAGMIYQPGEAAVRHGSLWICTAETMGEPMNAFGDWVLAVKRGSAA